MNEGRDICFPGAPLAAQITLVSKVPDVQGSPKINKRSTGYLQNVAQIGQNLSLEDLFERLAERLARLHDATTDFTSNQSVDDVNYLKAATKYGGTREIETMVAERLLELKIAELFRSVWNRYSEMEFMEEDQQIVYSQMMSVLIVMRNATDKSRALCEHVFKIDLHRDLLKYLSLPLLEPDRTFEYRTRRMVRGLTGVLHNLVQKFADSREPLREQGAVKILQRFRSAVDELVACLSLILQAYMISEAENEQINSDDKTFRYLVQLLQNILISSEHYSKTTGLNAVDVISALNRLAANDNNKARIVKSGALPLYVKMLQADCSAEEQSTASEGLWTLAFKCKDEIIKEPICVDVLEKLSTSSADKDVQHHATGALWILLGKDQDPPHHVHTDIDSEEKKIEISSRVEEKEERKEIQPVKDKHVFISYQWDNKSTVVQLTEGLKAAGFKVWVDVDNMSGSVLEAMALAVENAEVVLVCLSQKYKESPNCRTEAEYSFRLRKGIVPVRLQHRYDPDGWLGALIGSQLVHDFTDNDFHSTLNGLVRDLGCRGREIKTKPVLKEQVIKKEMETPMQAVPSSFGCENWTRNQVSDWLKKKGLQHKEKWFQEFDGSLLHEFRTMRRDAPDTFYAMLKDNQFTMMDILLINKALKDL